MRRHGKPLRRLLWLVPGSASQGDVEGGSRHPSYPLLGLALTHAVAWLTGAVWTFCFSIKRVRAHNPRSHTPKIDRGATGYDGLAYACGAAASRVAACSGSFQARPRRGMWRGVTIPPPHPLLGLALTHAVRLVDRRSADILFFPSKGTRAKRPPRHTLR